MIISYLLLIFFSLFGCDALSASYVNKETTFFNLESWQGDYAEAISSDNVVRQVFTLDALDYPVAFFVFQFTTTSENTWNADDYMILRFGPFNTTYTSQLETSTSRTHLCVYDLTEVALWKGNVYELVVEFSSTNSNAQYQVGPGTLGVYTKQEVASEICGPREPTGAENYPVFDTDNSGFLWNFQESALASETIYFQINVPRNFYDFEVAFDWGTDVTSYDETRSFLISASLPNETFWKYSDFSDTPCGRDTLSGYIPWTVLNEQKGGGLIQLAEWNNGTHLFKNDSWYYFGGTTYLFAREWVYTHAVNQHGTVIRSWEVERIMHWRVPFVIAMQRLVTVEDTFDHTPTCAAMDVEFTWSANSTRDTNILFSLLKNETVRLDYVCKNQCNLCHSCECVYTNETDTLIELRARVSNLTSELVSLRSQISTIERASDDVLVILTNQTQAMQDEWENAVVNGGLGCDFVPVTYCDGIDDCVLISGVCYDQDA